MKTPAGTECRYYYEDFHRGRSVQECRLIKWAPGARGWQPSDCARCAVPGILWANASENLGLVAEIRPGLLGIGRQVTVKTFCKKHDIPISDPYVGCELCASERPTLADLLEE